MADQWKKLRGQEVAPPAEYMEKLKSRKAEVGEQLDRSRAATRFEAPPAVGARPPRRRAAPAPGSPADAEAGPRGRRPARRPGPRPRRAEGRAAESYTNRLLKAKQKVWEEREKDKDKDVTDPVRTTSEPADGGWPDADPSDHRERTSTMSTAEPATMEARAEEFRDGLQPGQGRDRQGDRRPRRDRPRRP